MNQVKEETPTHPIQWTQEHKPTYKILNPPNPQ